MKQVDITVKKPWAPINLPLDTVSVEISRSWHTAYIALGSNMGDKKAYLDRAVALLDAADDCGVIRVSDYLVTEPYGGVEQDDFLNGALELKTLLPPMNCLTCFMKSKRMQTENESSTGDLVLWIWIFYSMMTK